MGFIQHFYDNVIPYVVYNKTKLQQPSKLQVARNSSNYCTPAAGGFGILQPICCSLVCVLFLDAGNRKMLRSLLCLKVNV